MAAQVAARVREEAEAPLEVLGEAGAVVDVVVEVLSVSAVVLPGASGLATTVARVATLPESVRTSRQETLDKEVAVVEVTAAATPVERLDIWQGTALPRLPLSCFIREAMVLNTLACLDGKPSLGLVGWPKQGFAEHAAPAGPWCALVPTRSVLCLHQARE
jgi:hypothetical protein